MRKNRTIILMCALAALLMTGCFGGKVTMRSGGEVVGTGGKPFREPAPYGMVQVQRGYLKMGLNKQDSLWGIDTPNKDISVCRYPTGCPAC